MSKVIVVTDSTAYIPGQLMEDYKIPVTPLQLIWGNEQFQDGVDILPVQFYERLKNSDIMPSTSQTTPGYFKNLYQELSNQGYEIFSIHISSKLSGTIDSAIQAKAMLEIPTIEIFDSQTSGMALGFQVLSVARAAANGANLKECLKIAEKARNQTGIYFAVRTLEFLHRGGRIGGAAAFVGTVLNLKPILEVRDGKIEAVDKVRTMNKAVDRIIELVKEKVKSHTPIRIAVQHANAAKEAEGLLQRITREFSENELIEVVIADVSPVIGTHTGPGVLGLAYMAGM